MTELKYKLIRVGKKASNVKRLVPLKYFQLVALRDIPEHGVKAGDLGGYITGKTILSHEGSCWIGGEAQVVDNVEVSGNAYIGGRAVVRCRDKNAIIKVSDNVRIIDNASIVNGYIATTTLIKGNAVISGDADLHDAAEVSGNSVVSGNVTIKEDAKILGNSIISQEVIVGSRCVLIDTQLSGLDVIPADFRLRNGRKDNGNYDFSSPESVIQEKDMVIKKLQAMISSQHEVEYRNSLTVKEIVPNGTVPNFSVKANENLTVFNEIKDNIASYENDIVKIIKYPSMVDPSVPETLEMTMALKKATRLSSKPESPEFGSALDDLEKKFILAQSNAFKLVSTMLSDADKKKAERAKDLFRIASNEASSENEKKTAFIQGFKQLEGVIPVPEIAIDTFRVKIGLKELEA